MFRPVTAKILCLYISSIFIILAGCAPFVYKQQKYVYSEMDWMTKTVHKRVQRFLNSCIEDRDPVAISSYTRIDSVIIDWDIKTIDIYINRYLADIPFRESNTRMIYKDIKGYLGRRFRRYTIRIYSKKWPIEHLIPNYFREDIADYDFTRMPKADKRGQPIVRNLDKPWVPSKGLYNRNIALWHSHGWYYEQSLNRWEWQRARLFQTVEDIGPIQYTIPYLIPMLENAGAQVFIPRERDFQTNEVIVDNDSYGDSSAYYREKAADQGHKWQTGESPGFAVGNPPYTSGVNLFELGSYRVVESDTIVSAKIEWIPDIPETGDYAVYISYSPSEHNVTDAHYAVFHSGGKTEFLVNQQIGGRTWIYLGKFNFKAGMNAESSKVRLTNFSSIPGKTVSADAVRFGGGMGNVARNGMVSGRPRYVEGARYYLQYAGMPDTLVYSFNKDTSDYRDDYQCRAEWVNFLKGAPFGPNKNRDLKGLGIPVDLSLAFHTDAGITKNNLVVGTLLIYSTEGADSTFIFPDGMSRMANRDFADILQSQIVDDIRFKYDSLWTRRMLWDRGYSEAYRPNVPASLLELLSHQNFLDMKFSHDPRFKFDVSRAIYKAMLRFIAIQYQYDYVVQPLPVSHFQTSFIGNRKVLLQWQPNLDPLEKSAVADKYIVYVRKEDNNFNNGILVDEPQVVFEELEPGVIYSFKVSAVNEGGESFPSEILSACWVDSVKETVLIINGFDRISAPATVETDIFAGFINFWDQGVCDKYDIGFTGNQFNFTPALPWVDDDAPGFGASYGDYETRVIPGNSFDFPYMHGRSIRTLGYPFVSVSDEVIMEKHIDITDYHYVDLILGEEKETAMPKEMGKLQFITFPEKLQEEIKRYCVAGGNLFISGAYVASDLFEKSPIDSNDIKFAHEALHFRYRTNHAACSGGIIAVDNLFRSVITNFQFNTEYHPYIYTVEAPDGIEPSDESAATILRYSENNISAAVAYRGTYNVVTLGFPFETILPQESRDKVMKAVFKYFKENENKQY